MYISSLSITNARKIHHLELHDLPERGVFLITGDNEAGKSTIMDCLRELWTSASNSNKQAIRSLQPLGRDVGPSVCMEAVFGATTARIRKQWLREKKSELSLSGTGTSSYTGREADDTFARLLNEHFDESLRSVLFVEQGKLDHAVKASGLPGLREVLSSASETEPVEVGTRRGVHDEASLLESARREMAIYITENRRDPTKEYKACQARLNEARDQLRQCEERISAYQQDLRDFERNTAALKETKARIPEEEKKLLVVEKRLREAEDAQKTWEQAKAAAENAERAVDQAAVAIAAREQMLGDIAARRKTCSQLKDDVQSLLERAEAQERQWRALDEACTAAREALAAQHHVVRRARVVSEAIAARDELRSIESQLDTLKELDAKRRRIDEECPSPEISDAQWSALAAAEQECIVQRRIAEETAAKLILCSDTPLDIRVDGEETSVEKELSLSLREGTSIEHAGLLMTYHRGRQDGHDSEEAVETAEQALADLLSAVHCESIAEAKDRYERCREARTAREMMERQRKDLLDHTTTEELERAREELQRRWDAAELNDDERQLSAADALEALSAAQKEEHQREEHREELYWRKEESPYQQEKEELIRVETQLSSAVAEQEALERRLAAAEKVTSMEQLRSAHDSARATAAELTAECEKKEELYRTLQPDLVRDEAESHRAIVQNLGKGKERLGREIARLGERLAGARGEEEKRDKLDSLVRAETITYERMTRQANAAELLYDTLLSHRRELQNRYSEPLRKAMNAMARRVFGNDSEVALDEDLAISARAGERGAITRDYLSGGAQEQLALIQRLSIAQLLQEQSGEIPPIFMDDVLGNSDATRLARMSQLLKEAGTRGQVFILTCYPRRYESIGGVHTYPIDSLMSTARGGVDA
ncbi:AAA family ATPase [Corynebacterium uropygiale]|uniref:AAA family ATPase n=1 Tax=Corynebacterium uropygiale TaxID=1775911 RepID=A0A9X1QP01_9CORY|nr:AAA family ATPase [Corynebacterium uropygiale]MCF4006927.1 AAA family ATPase [Corynebacterium uropygiale]